MEFKKSYPPRRAINYRTSPEEMAEIQKVAAYEKCSLSEVLRVLANYGLEAYKKERGF